VTVLKLAHKSVRVSAVKANNTVQSAINHSICGFGISSNRFENREGNCDVQTEEATRKDSSQMESIGLCDNHMHSDDDHTN
jgi:hypothetical protein